MVKTAFSLFLCAALLSASPGANLQPPAQATDPVPTVREKRSKVDFPVRILGVGAASESAAHELAGFGLRTKTFLNVKVYAMALYIDPATTVLALAPWKAKDAQTIQESSGVYEAILKPASGKTLRLVMRRGVDGDDMRDAFDDALAPRVARASRDFNMPGGAQALKIFRGYFDVDALKKDQVLDFTWHPANATSPGRLESRVNGVTKKPIENAALAWALFDVYLGADPIHTKEKPKMVKRLGELLGS